MLCKICGKETNDDRYICNKCYKELTDKINNLTNDIEAEPNNSYLYLERGNAKIEMEQYDEALKDFYTFHELGGFGWKSKIQYCSTIKKHLSKIEANPNSAKLYFDLGQYFIGQNQRETAVKYLDKAVEIKPNNDYYLFHKYYCIAEIEMKLQNYEKALICYNKALSFYKNESSEYLKNIYIQQYEAEIKLGKYEDALEHYKKFNKNFDNIDEYFQEKLINIIEDIEKINVTPDNAELCNQIGHHLISVDNEKAINYFDKAIKIEPDNPNHYLGKIEAEAVDCYDTGESIDKDIIEKCENLILNGTKYSFDFNDLNDVYIIGCEFDRDFYEKYLKKYPKDISAYLAEIDFREEILENYNDSLDVDFGYQYERLLNDYYCLSVNDSQNKEKYINKVLYYLSKLIETDFFEDNTEDIFKNFDEQFLRYCFQEKRKTFLENIEKENYDMKNDICFFNNSLVIGNNILQEETIILIKLLKEKADTLYDNKNYEKALKYFEIYLEINPDDTEVKYDKKFAEILTRKRI